jgi:hypothetical protein
MKPNVIKENLYFLRQRLGTSLQVLLHLRGAAYSHQQHSICSYVLMSIDVIPHDIADVHIDTEISLWVRNASKCLTT